MALTLKVVETRAGVRWVRDGFVQFVRRPLAFTALFVVFLFVAMAMALVPVVGGLLQMMMLPLLSLGFMIATQSALLDGRVQPQQFLEPLRGDPARRRSLVQLCILYGLGAVAILLLCDHLSDNAMQRLQQLMARDDSSPAKVDALLSEPGVTSAMLVGLVLGTLLSIPFWHAPALVYWGGQRAGQALFSSTLAVWRSKGAFMLYGLTWALIVLGFGLAVALLSGALGARQLGTLLAVPAGLLFSTVFYVSLLFTFNDSFGGGPAALKDVP